MFSVKRPYHTKKAKIVLAKLKQEKAKNGTYRFAEAIELLEIIFHGKCYLCENDKLTKIEIDHFLPQKGGENKSRKFRWSNLFWSCGHCNGIKGDNFDERKRRKNRKILNCTNSKHRVESWLSYRITYSHSVSNVDISIEIDEIKEPPHLKEIINNTVDLLNMIYNSDKPIKGKQADNLRLRLIEEIEYFNSVLDDYFENKLLKNESRCEELIEEIELALNRKTPFTAFKKWIIRDKPFFFEELKNNLTPKDFKNIFE